MPPPVPPQAAQAAPGDGAVWSALAQAYLDLKEYLEALESAVRATELLPSEAVGFLRLGQAYFHQDEFDSAREAFERARSLAGGRAEAAKAAATWLRKTAAELEAGGASPAAAPAAAPAPAAAAAALPEMVPVLGKYRYQWYQAGNKVVVDVMARDKAPDQVKVECRATELQVTVLGGGGEVEFALPVQLWGAVRPGDVRVDVKKPKVEITMVKADMADWKALEREGTRAGEPPKPEGAKLYPYASKKVVDWDKLEGDLKAEEKDEKLEGEAALQKLFK